MNKQDELSEQDRRLLEEIEQITLNGDKKRQQEDSVFGFCAHLASTVPQAGQDAQKRLEARLAERWKQLYEYEIEKDAKHRYGHFQAWSRYHPEQRSSSSPAGFALQISPQRTALAWAGLTLVLIALFSLFFLPQVRVLASQFLREVILGGYSSVQQLEWDPDDEVPASTENTWRLDTVLGGTGGPLPPGVDPTIRSFAGILEAREHTELLLQEPGYLPQGYALREIKLPPEDASENLAFLFYDGPDGEIILSMGRVGEEPGATPGLVTIKGSVITTFGSIEEVTVGEHPAAWIDGEMLAWEDGDILYQVGGHDLSLDTALRIAESVP